MLAPSAHVDTFTRDNLPPADAWPPLIFDPAVFGSSQPYPDRLNAAVELLDLPIATFGADRPALRRPPASSWTYGELRDRANQVAKCSTEDLGLVPGNRVLLRVPEQPVARRRLARRAQGRRRRGHVDAAAARRRARARSSRSPASTRQRWSTTAFTRRPGRQPGIRARVVDGRRRRRPGRPRCAASPASSRPSRPPPTTSPCSRSPPAPPAARRPRCTSTATCSRSPTPSRRTCCGRRRTTCSPAPPPFGFTFGLGGLVVFPLRAGAATLLIESATPDQLGRRSPSTA